MSNTELLAIVAEMRARRVNHGKAPSPTLEAWADRIEAALAAPPAAPVAQGLTLIPMENVQRIHDLACEGMSHGLLADDKCREILEVLATPNAVTEPLQGTQEPVAWHIGNADGSINKIGAVYIRRSLAEKHIESYGGELDARIVPLYAAPAPTQGTQEPSASAQQADAVTRDQVIEWGRLAGFNAMLEGERNLEKLADFAIFARQGAVPAPSASPKPDPDMFNGLRRVPEPSTSPAALTRYTPGIAEDKVRGGQIAVMYSRDGGEYVKLSDVLAQSAVTEPVHGTQEPVAVIPQGWRLVPIHPTDEIEEAIEEALRDEGFSSTEVGEADKRFIYNSALDAAPAFEKAVNAAPAPSQGTQEPVEFYTGGSFIRYVEIPAGFKMERISGDRWRVLAPSALPASPAMLQAAEHALAHAREWIGNKAHGDNCFVSAHYEGDPGDRCNCGKDAVLEAIDRVDFGESAAMSASKEGGNV